MEESNERAVKILLNGVKATSETIDLHYLFVKEAIVVLDVFIDAHIIDLKQKPDQRRKVYVITGYGKHSKDGLAKLKPAVMGRLVARKIR